MKVVVVEVVVDKVEVQMIKVVRRRRRGTNSAAPEHCETEEKAEKGATKRCRCGSKAKE